MTPKQKIYNDNLRDFGRLSPAQLMGLTIYDEAQGEPDAGKIAVGTVILERVEHRSWDGNTLHEVCLWPYQFSGFNPGNPRRVELAYFAWNFPSYEHDDNVLAHCYEIADAMLYEAILRDPDLAAAHCCQYLTTAAKAKTDWWKSMKFIKKIGNHEFFA